MHLSDAGAEEQAIKPALRGGADLRFFIGAKIANHHPIFGAPQFTRPAVRNKIDYQDHFQKPEHQAEQWIVRHEPVP
ncbi:hypothetical protein ACH5Y9_04955 [Methylomonas sp. BW4-1]|uniref:hypothetical protein n=1 Tax=Methylomonas sp. BW4-1 TaxID=3376685 RepID=UPI004042CA4A